MPACVGRTPGEGDFDTVSWQPGDKAGVAPGDPSVESKVAGTNLISSVPEVVKNFAQTAYPTNPFETKNTNPPPEVF